MAVKIWRFVTLLLVALLTGLAFAHVLERPAKMHYDATMYIYLQQTLYAAWGPPNIGGMLELAAILSACVLAFVTRQMRSAFFLTLAAVLALLFAFPAVFFILVEPANVVFRTVTSTSIPSNWMDLRVNWESGHALRFVLQLLALALLLISVLIENHRRKDKLAGLSKEAMTKLKMPLPRNCDPVTRSAIVIASEFDSRGKRNSARNNSFGDGHVKTNP